ncbi:hypothetical protein J6590_028911 [Homalodisca vitripennis]|nr:hypothetical protein J6590_028911 [Homalodisca vitripennis]
MEDYEEVKRYLCPRLSESKAILVTQKCHSFIPFSENHIILKPFYFSLDESLEYVTSVYQITATGLRHTTSGFVTIAYENSWRMGCIETKINNMYRVNFLHPKGPSHSFFYQQPRDILEVPGNTLFAEGGSSNRKSVQLNC